MFWKKKDTNLKDFDKKSVIDRRTTLKKLYSGRKKLEAKMPDFSKLEKDDRVNADYLRFVRQFYNCNIGGHWCFEEVDHFYGRIGTYDMPNHALCFLVWHGEICVGRLEHSLYVWGDAKGEVRVRIDKPDYFDASELRHFFSRVSSIHTQIVDDTLPPIDIVPFNVMIDRAMSDALWNAFSNMRAAELDNFSGEFAIERIDLTFSGDMGGYDERLEYWKSKGLDPYELERQSFENSEKYFSIDAEK